MRLYLDFDGVLHRSYEAPPFEAMDVFVRAVEPLVGEGLQIVLATTWVSFHGYHATRDHLPEPIRSAVIGATFDPSMRGGLPGLQGAWALLSRYTQISQDAARRGWDRLGWLALDDDDREWPDERRDQLVHVDDSLSLLGQPGKADELVARLRALGPAPGHAPRHL